MIVNGKDKPLALASAALPDMTAGLAGLLQPMTFVKVTKTNVDGLVQEIENKVRTTATRYPMKPQEVALKPEGQRTWKWETLLAVADLILKPDDIVKFDGQPYRVMGKSDWKEYGFVQYDLAQDFTAEP